MELKNRLIGSIEDEEEVEFEEESDLDEEKETEGKAVFAKGFKFDLSDEEDDITTTTQTTDKKSHSSLDSKIVAKRLKLKKQNKVKSKKVKEKEEEEYDDDDGDENEDDDDEEEEDDDDEGDRVKEKNIKIRKKEIKLKKQQKKEQENENIAYGEVIKAGVEINEFSDMDLSRPINRAINALGWSKPTPIQSSTIPVALMGTDICACAATGTGKTGAFMIPILERLVHKPHNQHATTRVLVLTPTRELAVQIYQVSKQLAQFTKITFSLAAGGLDRGSQEAALRLGPDVVIATLGRLIDHLQNAPNFNLNTIEILVLDEADRMLDEYFEQQMKEVIQRCSIMRQTMLFSATMTEKVKDLAFLSLKNPTKIFVNENQEVALNLQQEFVRIRPSMEGSREAIVAALVKRTFHQRTIIFIETKKLAHRLHIILGLLGLKVAQLHGNLSQTQRLDALENFKEARIDVLIATDLVGRGLDIDGIKTVINMCMPASLERYIHRVGRTARAGKSGRSITLVGDGERKLFEKAVKASKIPVKMRTIPAEVIAKFKGKLKRLEKEVEEIEAEEEAEKELRIAELKANKACKIMEGGKEQTTFKRSWFQTHKQRQEEKNALKENLKKKKGDKDENFR